ncbi:hypothetical protein LTR62_003666 [Meristemomyces frigidus]|uniref:SWIRM domain-containing protein n=1 Tax=Meristemomyces frigidus TaxID=1508187 RepID=A0AAN7YRN0_9PEZI|nr:hypothetical protein LTR62_003666 [Meristemomyces frigidus]
MTTVELSGVEGGDISVAAAISDRMFPLGTHTKPLSTIDEDDSSLSSTATDIFDSNDALTKGQWAYDSKGTWRRYGSSESATSTGISSICSSVLADKPDDQGIFVSMSKKRMADGSMKQNNSTPDIKPEDSPAPVTSTEITITAPLSESRSPAQKRRGRPPKDKTTIIPPAGKARRASMISKLQDRVRPRSSLPAQLPKDVFASECIEAAQASRLDPYALHIGEHQLLSELLMHTEVTIYLNIRNAILRLWQQNPLCSITVEEAAGCAREGRFFGLAEVAYKWLVRNGYINFGCVEVPQDELSLRRNTKQKTIVVIGAGVSGLSSARQLDGLFAQNSEHWTDAGERPPQIIVLEGRKRIGGRVYSKPLRSQVDGSLPGNLRNTAEMGAMIVTGFDHGNPLNTVIRGQLGLRYHLMTDALTIYDTDGQAVEEKTDQINTELYTDISDRAGDFRAEPQKFNTLKGDEELIDRARDPIVGGFSGFQLEPLFPVDNAKHRKPVLKRGRRRNAPPGTEKLTGRSRVIEESDAAQSAARAAKTMGWQLKDGVAKNQSISLRETARAKQHPTLGKVMDEAIEQYQDIVDLTPQDMRLLNWHHANLEYANAAPVSWLSLSGHDQDTGNEFEGAHSEIVGGYTQLPRGLMNLPTKLDVRFDHSVDSIHYNVSQDPALTTKVVCTNGEVFEADEVVLTTPLGVLKADAIDFDPPLPGWKQGAIDRMGFGLLNKLVLLYDKPFWDDSRDMFGLLNEADYHDSLDPAHYAKNRGRFYLIWNASKTSGRPMLVALMAGHSAHEAEKMDTDTLLGEVNHRLRKTFSDAEIPAPTEVIVTRWKRDPFTRGTYSYVAPETRAGDYDLMAESVGNLHFAGEATCGTHPATVHGAFLSGLRVGADVMEALTGPIILPNPLVGPSPIKAESSVQYHLPAISTAAYRPAIPSTQMVSGATMSGSITVGEPVINVKQEQDLADPHNAPSLSATTTKPPPLAKQPSGPPRNSVCAADQSFWLQSAAFESSDLDYEANIIAAILVALGDRPIKPSRPGVNPFLLFTKAKWEECRLHCAALASSTSSNKSSSASDGKEAIRGTIGKWWKALSAEEKEPFLLQGRQAQEVADQARREYEEGALKWDEGARRIRREFMVEHPPPAGSGGVGGKRKTNTSASVVLDYA